MASQNVGSSAIEKTTWTWRENKVFENSLAEFPEECVDRWEKIAAKVGTKSAAEVSYHYALLVDDIMAIEAGVTPLPNYAKKNGSGTSKNGAKKRSPIAWTAEEHSQFLVGLEKYGKGDWKSIARHSVLTKTASQVASHAQKHFERQAKDDQDKKYHSIFDNKSSTSADGGPAN